MQSIIDGSGNCNVAKVDSDLRLHVQSTNQNENQSININKNNSFLVYSDITSGGATNTIFYMENTSELDMIVNWYRIWSGTSAEALDLYIGRTGTPAGTTSLTPNNMNINSNKTASGNFYEGTDITGLSGGVLLDRLRLAGNGEDVTSGYPGDIVITKGGNVSVDTLNGSIATEITVSFYYKEQE